MAISPLIAQDIVRRIAATKTIEFAHDPTDTGGPDVSRQLTDQQIIQFGIATRAELTAGRAAFFAAQRVRPSHVRTDPLARSVRTGRLPRFALRKFITLQPAGSRGRTLKAVRTAALSSLVRARGLAPWPIGLGLSDRLRWYHGNLQ